MNNYSRLHKFKKIIIVLLLLIISIGITACVDELPSDNGNNNNGLNNDTNGNNNDANGEKVDYLDIFSINDLHGAVEDIDGRGLARIGNFLIKQKEENPLNTIIIAAGDMFQGSGVSNLSYGGVVVEAMNEIGFDAMTIGNHEFDWGVDKLTRFIDNSDSDVKANFPFLGANIYEKATNRRVPWAESYTIIERGGLKVGIIGTIGPAQINSITASLVSDFRFERSAGLISFYARDLRTNHNVDFVIVSTHDYDENFNKTLAKFTQEETIDAVVTAHTHWEVAEVIQRHNNVPMPIVQAGDYGRFIGHIKLEIDFENRKITNSTVRNIPVNHSLSSNHPEIEKIINAAVAKATPILNEVVATAGRRLSKSDVTSWGTEELLKYTNADFAVINFGAFRTGFPVNKGQDVKVKDIFEWMPFDNRIKQSEMTKEQILQFANNTSLTFASRLNPNYLEENRLYTVAAVDYIFEKDYYPFISGHNHTTYNKLYRDILIDALRKTKQNDELWFG